jgi:hypothetical protein
MYEGIKRARAVRPWPSVMSLVDETLAFSENPFDFYALFRHYENWG